MGSSRTKFRNPDSMTELSSRCVPSLSNALFCFDGVGCHLRCVDDDIAHERTVEECFVAKIMALVVGHDGAKVGVGVADMDDRGIVALDVDRRGSGRSGNRRRGRCAYLNLSLLRLKR